ncbi:Os10g0352500, partial [Oryza sativa Japonica Group]
VAFGVDMKKSKLILVGASAICWTLWLSRNDMVFDKSLSISYMQVIFRATHWLRFWAQLQRRDEDGEFLKVACRKLETMVMQLYANYGWRFTNRLE